MTFEESVAHVERLCRAEIERCGGRELIPSEVSRGARRFGYVFDAPIEKDSAADYAIRILRSLALACSSRDRDVALSAAYAAGALATDAATLFPQRKRAKMASAKAAAKRGAPLGEAWAKKVAERRPGLTKEAVYQQIERQERLQPGTVKKAVLRASRRK